MYLLKCFSCLQLKNEESITKLDFSNNNLSEVFPQIWQYERTLEELHLASARLSSLPPQLFYCQSLRVLVVSSNNLENIPSAIGSLRQLQHLNLYRNLISSVPDTIKSCKNLTYLDLSCNNLQRLPDALTSVISLQELYLNETYLEFLPANFGRLVNLRILELRLNNLVTLPKSMVRLSNLQRMDIGANEFTELPEVIGELKQLRELWIDLNQIRRMSRNVTKLKELIHFEANGNLLEQLPNELFQLPKIEVLSFCMNSLQTLPLITTTMKLLVTLKCESNELYTIPDSISHLENLEELVLSHNHLRALPATIGMLRKLRFLFVDDNLLDGLPPELCSCSELRVLSVCSNRITELPQDIGHLSALTVLNLVNNRITHLPVSVLSLANLKSLWLSDNQSQPLVPLQYVDVNNKTQLTCFMLPQHATHSRMNAGVETEELYASNANYTEQLENKRALQPTANYGKRICFAEEATIVTGPQTVYNNSSNAETLVAALPVEQEPFEVRLLRSPTPYPKELRLMAKYLRTSLNDNAQLRDQQAELVQHAEATPVDMYHVNNAIHRTAQQLPANTLYIEAPANYYVDDFEPQPNTSTFVMQSTEQSQGYTQTYTDAWQKESHIMYQSLEADQEAQQALHLPNNAQAQTAALDKPPPYHIARSFTKKSPATLTEYDVLSQQLLAERSEWSAHTPYDAAHTHEVPVRDVSATSNLLDQQNNNVEANQARDKANKDEAAPNNAVNRKDSTVSNTAANKTPWLFGTHKNPTVKQISLKWSTQLGFEITKYEHQDGIFVASVMDNTNAAKLLCIKDKLLEVDGCDFTKISLNDARNVLSNPCPVLNIMISRI